MSTREQGERLRAFEHLKQLRAMLDAVDIAIGDDETPPGWDAAQAMVSTAVSLATSMARLDAYHRAVQDSAISAEDREALGDARAAVKLYRRSGDSAMTQSEHDRAVAVLDRLMDTARKP